MFFSAAVRDLVFLGHNSLSATPPLEDTTCSEKTQDRIDSFTRTNILGFVLIALTKRKGILLELFFHTCVWVVSSIQILRIFSAFLLLSQIY